MFTVYILHSLSINKFYTGYSSLAPHLRLAYHLTKHNGFTAKAKDWIIVYTQNCDSKVSAMALECKIKKRGASRFLNDLNLLEQSPFTKVSASR